MEEAGETIAARKIIVFWERNECNHLEKPVNERDDDDCGEQNEEAAKKRRAREKQSAHKRERKEEKQKFLMMMVHSFSSPAVLLHF